MTPRSFGSADAAPESRLRRAPSTASASCSGDSPAQVSGSVIRRFAGVVAYVEVLAFKIEHPESLPANLSYAPWRDCTKTRISHLAANTASGRDSSYARFGLHRSLLGACHKGRSFEAAAPLVRQREITYMTNHVNPCRGQVYTSS